MDEKPDQIMSHIESQRDELGRNLSELETRVKSATDWRVQFDKNPMLMMGVALGGGLLLGSIVGGAKKSSGRSNWSSSRNYSSAGSSMGLSSSGTSASTPSSSSSAMSSPALREQRKKANETLDHMKAALIGFATAKVKEFMSEALPGFNQHLDEAERRYASSPGGYDNGLPGSGSSYGSQASTRTEHSANSPYVQQGAGQNTGLKV